MAANEMSFNQVATVLNAIQNIVTGKNNVATIDTSTFCTAADITLKTGYEKVYNAISMVLGRTIFSIRPYDRKLKGLEMTDGQFKMHTRKLQILDTTFEDNDTVKYPVHWDAGETVPSGNGESVDQQVIKKSEIVQTNFYGMNTYQDHYTIFDEQLDVAFSSPEELGRFFSMITMNISNMFEQAREDFARYTLVNFLGALYDLGSGRVIHLLTEYNAVCGLTGTDDALTATSVYLPANFPAFIKWFAARMRQISQEMTERSIKYQSAINSKYITRHTPINRQRIFMFAPALNQIDTMVLSSVFHDSYLKQAYTEAVTYWQGINQPDQIDIYPSYMGPSGTVIKGSRANSSGIFGVIMDEEACGYTIVKSTMKNAPYNARADYQNFFLKDYHKNFNDVSEKAVLLVLD